MLQLRGRGLFNGFDLGVLGPKVLGHAARKVIRVGTSVWVYSVIIEFLDLLIGPSPAQSFGELLPGVLDLFCLLTLLGTTHCALKEALMEGNPTVLGCLRSLKACFAEKVRFLSEW
jgi:hypothetical protein